MDKPALKERLRRAREQLARARTPDGRQTLKRLVEMLERQAEHDRRAGKSVACPHDPPPGA